MRRSKKALFVLFSVIVFSGFCCTMSGYGRHSRITVLTYNVQNLFDAADNGSEYSEFDPSGGVWNEILYNTRLLNLSETIKAAVPGGPDIMAFQEIENKNVVEDLVSSYLKGMGYSYYAVTGKKGSAVQLAVVSRFPITGIRVHDQFSAEYTIRPVLEVEIDTDMGIIYLFNNHWKSGIGGKKETEPLRIMSASVIRERLRAVAAADSSAGIIVAGDLNENYDEYLRAGGEYETALMPYHPGDGRVSDRILYISGTPEDVFFKEPFHVLYEPWADSPEFKGSYNYKGHWETIDHILINSVLFDSDEYCYSSFEVETLPFLMNGEGRPYMWNTRTGAGYSDHLPLMITFTRK